MENTINYCVMKTRKKILEELKQVDSNVPKGQSQMIMQESEEYISTQRREQTMNRKIYSEKYLERKLVERVQQMGGICLKFSSITATGYPDRICMFPEHRTVWVELKTTGKRPTKLQLVRHQELRDRGFSVCVVDSMETLEQAVSDGAVKA